MHERSKVVLPPVTVFLIASALLVGCDAPTVTESGPSATPNGPSMLITPACAGSGGQTHAATTITTAQRWTRATSPHRVMGGIYVNTGGLLTIEPGVVICFEPGMGIYANNGGRLHARGQDTSRIIFTARDPARGWSGLRFEGSPAISSYLTFVRIEHVALNAVAVTTNSYHPVTLDSAVIRQSGWAVELRSPGSYMRRSRVDTTTNRNNAAIYLENGARFEQVVVRRSAGVGVRVRGSNVLILDGRVEGSGGVGLQVQTHLIHASSRGPRVVAGRSYGGEMPLPVLAKLYATPALQDDLRGNARDTVIVLNGELRSPLTVGPRLPLLIDSWGTNVGSAGVLTAQAGASLVFRGSAGLTFNNGGRLVSRGKRGLPVRFTADDPAEGWNGLQFSGSAAALSYVTNTHIEHVSVNSTAIVAHNPHQVIVDSSVIRQSGRAVSLYSLNSRLSRTRVDTTLDANSPAVQVGGNVRLESTRITAPAGPGLYIGSSTSVVVSCEVRGGDKEGILMNYYWVAIHNCNLVNNQGPGILNSTGHNVDVKNNWWGSRSGPNSPGGDGISGPLDYTPWRTTPYVLPYVP
ncbi:right-handed parallel beta-helix repeat-containing protein [Longimicrobium sp.]|uniref:right-handed parallel beta-helix repeat-containing protein n=1 Tax=Longimicrobium sp. TaxID=2029185 RepID=UPI003B3B18DE